LPCFGFPENAALALAAAVRYGRWRKRPRGNLVLLAPERQYAIRRIVERVRAEAGAPVWASAGDLARILALADIPLAELAQVGPDPDQAAAAADRIGYPVVVKAVARGLVHKSDVGGVLLGVDSQEAVRAAVATLARRMKDAGHVLEGVIVQHQVEEGVEAIVGVTIDPSLGPLLVAGLGGVQVELLRDVALRITPVSDLDAADMLDGLRAAKLLDGFRGAPPADRASLLALIQKVSALAEAIPELLELELNPVKGSVRISTPTTRRPRRRASTPWRVGSPRSSGTTTIRMTEGWTSRQDVPKAKFVATLPR
jgi:hypothetical protein